MATLRYAKSSPWHNTTIGSTRLDYFKIRPVPESGDDFLYTVEPQYNHRPDLLAYDLYNDSKLWWIFAQRNMDVLKDPVFDLEPGVEIYIPQGPKIRELLGI